MALITVPKIKQTEENDIAELMKVLENIDTDSPTSLLNETTISDNNGGRIEL